MMAVNLRVLRTIPALHYAIAAMCNALKISETIDDRVAWDKDQVKVSPGTMTTALIVNILCNRRALWKVWEWYDKSSDSESLFGPGMTSDAFNDDAIGRTLDRVYEYGPKKLYSEIAIQAINLEGETIDSVHADTTSISLEGQYDICDSSDNSDTLKITFGHSKDHRPDLKQFNIGLLVTRSGIPFNTDVMDGNKADKVWNMEVIDALKKEIKINNDFVYVADSAMATKDNLDTASTRGISFISRLPDTFTLSAALKDKAWAMGQWNELGTFSTKKNAAVYKAQSFTDSIEGIDYRFIVVHSSSLDKRKEATIEKNLVKEGISLETQAAALWKVDYACEPDACLALETFLKEHSSSCRQISGHIEMVTQKNYGKRGRPVKGVEPSIIETFRVKIVIGEPVLEKVKALREKASTFILITNLHDDVEWPAERLLAEYKGQTSVEQKFRFLKGSLFLGGVFLKRPDRVESLSYIFVLAALVASLLERRVREYLKANGQKVNVGGNIMKDTPTIAWILEDGFTFAMTAWVLINGALERVWNSTFEPRDQRLLDCTGLDYGAFMRRF